MERTENLGGGRRAQLLTELAAELESRDPFTHGHSRRVAHHATMIAVRLGLSAGEIVTVRAAAALHDVGKINTPACRALQAGPTQAGGVRPDHAPSRGWGRDRRHSGRPGADCDGPSPPRAARWNWLPGRPGGQRYSPRGSDHRRRRHVRCDHLDACLSARQDAREGDGDPRGAGPGSARSRRGERLQGLLQREPSTPAVAPPGRAGPRQGPTLNPQSARGLA
jgi:HD domain